MKAARSFVLPGALTTALLILPFWIEPLTTGGQDAVGYLERMQGFLDHGVRWNSFREPLYPLFLALLSNMGLAPSAWAPWIQTWVFAGSFFFFLWALFGKLHSGLRLWTVTATISLIPTFLIPMNGALYTESLAASLTLVFLGASTRLFVAKRLAEWKSLSWAGLAAVSVILLDLLKGSSIYIHYLAPLFLLALGWKFFQRKKLATTVGVLILMGLAGRGAVSLWFGMRDGEPLLSKKVYARGGAVLLGRVTYAENFDFKTQSVPFLLQALSDKGCRVLIGPECERYGFLAEERSSSELHRGRTDEELMSEGLSIILRSPIRQSVYALFVLTRFVFHHSTTGFARLEFPLLGAMVHSSPFLVLLKVFNLVLYFYVPVVLGRRRKQWPKLRKQVAGLPLELRFGATVSLAYSVALLAIHGFVWSVVRMCYPIAPLLVVFNWAAWTILARSNNRGE